MTYSIEPKCYKKTFSLPCTVAEKLRLADAVKLRAVLWIFSECPDCIDSGSLSGELGCTADEAEEALLFWAGEGVLSGANSPAASCAAEAVSGSVSAASRTSGIPSLPGKPTSEEAVSRGEDAEISTLLSDIQVRLGRTINSSEMCTVVWIHDTLGLPSAVIMMIAEYALCEGKSNLRYIEKLAVQWANEEIDTPEKAEAKLLSLALSRKSWQVVRAAFGIEDRRPSEKELSLSKTWVSDWGFSKAMLRLAYDASVDSTGKMKMAYINKVLAGWQTSGIRTPEEVKASRLSRESGEKKPAASFSADDLAALVK